MKKVSHFHEHFSSLIFDENVVNQKCRKIPRDTNVKELRKNHQKLLKYVIKIILFQIFIIKIYFFEALFLISLGKKRQLFF